MLQIEKRCQMFSPGEDFSLSSLSAEYRAKINKIWGMNSSGTSIVVWDPTVVFPLFTTLKSNEPYMIQSRLLDGAFVPYDLPIEPNGLPSQDDTVSAPFHFLAYEADDPFFLSDLSSEVKSRINDVYAEGITATSNFSVWTPSTTFGVFRSFESGGIYLITSFGEGFAEYSLGLPDLPDELSFLDDSLLPDVGLIPNDFAEI